MASEIKVDTIVNAGGDNDSGIDLATNDTIKLNIAGAEKARMDSSGTLMVGKTSSSTTSVGVEARTDGTFAAVKDGGGAAVFGRNSDDGTVVTFRKDGTSEGAISVASDVLKIFATKSTSNCGLGFFSNNTVRPLGNDGTSNDDEVDMGHTINRFDNIRATNGTIQTSDKNEKNTIVDSDLGLDFVNRLSPKSYKFNNKTRTHYGLIAQDVETVLGDVKKDATQFAGFCKDDISEKQDGSEYKYGLRYHEFISPMIQAIKDLKEEVDTLKAKVTVLEGK